MSVISKAAAKQAMILAATDNVPLGLRRVSSRDDPRCRETTTHSVAPWIETQKTHKTEL